MKTSIYFFSRKIIKMKNKKESQFNDLVLNKYHIYNSLFMKLPYETENVGMLIPILSNSSEEGFKKGQNPKEIIEDFFLRYGDFASEEDQIKLLFRIIQYVERQVVLFDSIEDTAFKDILALGKTQDLEDVRQIAAAQNKATELKEKLSDFGVRIVFTAHPTQFYPPVVQRIIHDLSAAIGNNSINEINVLLQQLGKTSFINKEKPTPYDEAKSIIYYLRYVYYDAIGELYKKFQGLFPNEPIENLNLVRLGFWPGGDRDGNPFVTANITRQVADELRTTLMKCYYNHLKKIRRRLTFRNIEPILTDLSNKLYQNMFGMQSDLSAEDILNPLYSVRNILKLEHDGLFSEVIEDLIARVKLFQTHFATVDIRQDHSVHQKAIQAIIEKYQLSDKAYEDLSNEELIEILTKSKVIADEHLFADPLVSDTIKNIKQLKTIQRLNGEAGCDRYIISNSEDVLSVLNVFGLFRFCGWASDEITFDIIPLFETIKGLSDAESTMNTLYNMPIYAAHLEARRKRQTIMLGFSDGTKDGGYLKANWEIFKTKETLSKVSDKNGIKVVFFDGRGGPPARGGGKTHRFYASQGKNIANNEIQLTIQGQTITSMYGTVEQFKHNCEQLITAGITNDIFDDEKTKLSEAERDLMNMLGEGSYEKYQALKQHEKFIPYLEQMSTLKYYGKANIGSRPGKRGSSKQLTLSDLRAISFVGSWSQLKQNVPGYFGIGTAISQLKEAGRLDEVKALFQNVSFFQSLILNSMMSMTKSNFALTRYMKDNPEFGAFWDILHDEYELSKAMMLEISGFEELMEAEPVSKASINIREKIVLPLLTIQQYALQKVAEQGEKQSAYEKMVMRSLFGNVNASRNSA
jgi:phosphoenolpyruvate carboxylase